MQPPIWKKGTKIIYCFDVSSHSHKACSVKATRSAGLKRIFLPSVFEVKQRREIKKGGVPIHRCCSPEQWPTCWAALLLGNGVLDRNWLGEFGTGRWEWVVWLVFKVSLAGSRKTQHYAESSANTSFSDCYFVAPCGRYRALTVAQAEWPPLTSCPPVQILRYIDALDQTPCCMSWMPGLSLLSCVPLSITWLLS